MDFQSENSFGKLRLRAFQPYHQILCMSKHVEDVKDGKRTYRHTFIIPFLIWYHLNVILCMSKMSKIDQIHLRAVMLCMLKMSKMGKEHTHTFWLITSLILNGFSIRKKFWKAETESFPTIPSNPMYVEACQRWEKNIHTHFWLITFINTGNGFSIRNLMYVGSMLKTVRARSNHTHQGCNPMYIEARRRWEKNIHTHFGS